MDPNVFLTLVFVSWVIAFAIGVLAVVHHERRREERRRLPPDEMGSSPGRNEVSAR
jgi:hypothetical protein